MSFSGFNVFRRRPSLSVVRESRIERLETRRLMAAGGITTALLPAPSSSSPVLSQSLQHARRSHSGGHHGGGHHGGGHHHPTPKSTYLGSFVGTAQDFNPSTNSFQDDGHFSITITTYTPAPAGGRGSISGTVATRHGSVTFSGFTGSNFQGGFAYGRGTDTSDPNINHGTPLVITATLGRDGKLTGSVSGTIGIPNVSESFVSLRHA
jgi:hypothetical protein